MSERLERTELGQQEFDRQCPDVAGKDIDPRERLTNLARGIMQQIIAESPYKPDMEWELFHQSRVLEDEAQLPEGVTSQMIMENYYSVFHKEDQ